MRYRNAGRMRILIPLLLFLVMAILLMSQTAMGAGIYARSQEKESKYFEETTFSDYIRTKIGAVNKEGSVRIGHIGKRDALFLQDDSENGEYETVLYVYKGSLMEQYGPSSGDISMKAGSRILDAEDLRLSKSDDHCIRCSLKQKGTWQDTYVFVTGKIGK